MNVAQRMALPSAAHWLGQDEYGRDVLSRLLWGARVSLTVAAASASIACVLGTALGVTGGFLGGIVEFLAIRSVDVVLCFPPLLLALLVVTLLGPGAATLVPVLALVYLPSFVRVSYAGVLSVRSAEYVEAMRVLGAGSLRIMVRTILPNIGGPILVQFSLTAASAVVLESGLSFLGLGVVPPAPSWGLMIAAARSTMAQAPLLLLWPCLALSLTILAMNALCDALRDAVDPHRRPRRRARRLLGALVPGMAPQRGAVLDVVGLTVEIDTPAGPIQPVRDVSLHVRPGETLAVVGESGSGKSLLGLAVMGAASVRRPGCERHGLAGRHRYAAARRGQHAPPARRTRRHGVPGSAEQPEPGASRRCANCGDSALPPPDIRPGAAPACERVAAPGRHPRPIPQRRRLPARIIRRHASTRHDRDGHRQQPAPADRRRADHGARRHHSGAGAGAARRAQA